MEPRICLVTGASRGAGRGIALALAEQGATVYVTGRTIDPDDAVDGMKETIGETAQLVSDRGGTGIAVACDHREPDDVRTLIDRIEQDHGKLHLLVNNAWGGYESYDMKTFDAPFWEANPELWTRMIGNGVRLSYITSRAAAPLMIAQRSGLIVNVTAWDRDRYLHALVYDVAKAAVNRMAFGMAQELRRFGIAVIALAPGWMRTERVMQAHAEHPFDLSSTESPEYVGRVIAALVSDTEIMSKTGQTFRAGDLAPDYDVYDVDGSQPPGFDIPLYGPDDTD
jgi:NAD(P)-dependent dehydrogenase (short-subunit alcohol dehydrogenase family)